MQFNTVAQWHHRVSSGARDSAGNAIKVPTSAPWPCVYDPGSSGETGAGVVSQAPRLIGNPGNAVPSDSDGFTVTVAGVALRFEVNGDPAVHASPFPSGQNKIGPVVELRRVEH